MKLSEKEKSELRNRISISISKYIHRKRYLQYGLGLAAAIVFILFSKNFFNSEVRTMESMETVVESLNKQNIPDQIQLKLNNGQSLEVVEDEASISYSKTGEQISFGNSKSYNQSKSSDNKIAFNTLIVPYGKRSSIVLSDGSKIWLNSGSKLVFPTVFSSEKREVYLEGEGIFEVAHDKKHPFVVKLKEQTIEVLGTVFNVSNYHDDGTVGTVLKSGSVKINYKNGTKANSEQSITIVPGTLASLNRKEMHLNTSKVDVEKYFSWRDGMFIFKNDSMESIMKKIARYYNIEIVINDKHLAQATFSGYLDVKDNVQNVIKTIEETTKFEYTLNDNKLIIN